MLIDEYSTRSATLHNLGVDPVSLDPIAFDNGFITCSFPGAVLDPGESVVIEITYIPQPTRDTMATDIEIIGSTFSGTITLAGRDTADPTMFTIRPVQAPASGTDQIIVLVELTVDDDLCMAEFQILYDNTVLTALDYSQAGSNTATPQTGGIDDVSGTVTFSYGEGDGMLSIPSGTSTIAEIVFERKPGVGPGTYPLTIANVKNVFTTSL